MRIGLRALGSRLSPLDSLALLFRIFSGTLTRVFKDTRKEEPWAVMLRHPAFSIVNGPRRTPHSRRCIQCMLPRTGFLHTFFAAKGRRVPLASKCCIAGTATNPEGPSRTKLGTWELGNSNSLVSFGQVYDYWVLGPLGKDESCWVSMTA